MKMIDGNTDLNIQSILIIINALPNAILIVDLNGVINLANTSAGNLLRCTTQDLIGKSIEDFIPENFLDNYAILQENCFEKQGIFSIGGNKNVTGLRSDGTEVFVEISLSEAAIPIAGKKFRVVSLNDRSECMQILSVTQDREVYYRNLFEMAPQPYQSIDINGNIIEVNQAWLEFFNCKKEDALGSHIRNFISLSSCPCMESAIDNFKHEDYINISAIEMKHCDSHEIVVVSIKGRIERDKNGCFVHAHCLLTDISARIKNEGRILQLNEKLKEKNRLFERISSTVPAMIYDYILHPDGRSDFIYVSSKCKEILELGEEDLIKDSRLFWNIVHPDDFNLLKSANKNANDTETFFSAELRIITGSGKIKWIQLSSNKNPSKLGEPAVWSGFLVDITERKNSEEELKEYQNNLNSHIQLLQHLTSNIPGMVYQYTTRPDGRFKFSYVSEGVRDIYRMTPKAVLENSYKVLGVLHPDDKRQVLESIQSAARMQKIWQQRYRVRFTDGTVRWVQGNATPQNQTDGNCLWNGFITDVTAEVEAEEKMRLAASVFANAQEGITIADANGLILDVNPAFTRITSYRRDEALGRSQNILSSGHHDQSFYALMWKSLAETGGWRGEIWNRRKSGEVYSELLSISTVKNNVNQISHYIGTFSDISSLERNEAKLDRLAHYDPLTGLANRRLLNERLQQGIVKTRQTGKIMAVCTIDIDKLKNINNRFGYKVGDQVLVHVSQRIFLCVRDNDTVARTGDDEFVVVLLNIEWIEECDTILSAILDKLTTPMEIGGEELCISVNIGVTLFPQDEASPDNLLGNADCAMYLSKKSGYSQYKLFDAAHDRLLNSHRRLTKDLAEALKKNQFILHYQPKIEMATGKVVGVEGLIRWCHPERGLLLPAEFLYAVADSHMDVSVGLWVVDCAIRQIALFKEDGINLPISINLSIQNLCDVNFIDYLKMVLDKNPIVLGSDFEIEIKESAAFANIENIAITIKACQEIGVRIALDDFGTGDLSFTSFKKLHVDILKIDQNIVRDMCHHSDELEISEVAIKIAKVFQRDIIAEGVETIEQGLLLMQLGCPLAQGYAIARPMPPDSLLKWLKNWQGESRWGDLGGSVLYGQSPPEPPAAPVVPPVPARPSAGAPADQMSCNRVL